MAVIGARGGFTGRARSLAPSAPTAVASGEAGPAERDRHRAERAGLRVPAISPAVVQPDERHRFARHAARRAGEGGEVMGDGAEDEHQRRLAAGHRARGGLDGRRRGQPRDSLCPTPIQRPVSGGAFGGSHSPVDRRAPGRLEIAQSRSTEPGIAQGPPPPRRSTGVCATAPVARTKTRRGDPPWRTRQPTVA